MDNQFETIFHYEADLKLYPQHCKKIARYRLITEHSIKDEKLLADFTDKLSGKDLDTMKSIYSRLFEHHENALAIINEIVGDKNE